jgi:hypothetical protein
LNKETLDILLLTGRPASGKSEIIHFLTHTPLPERRLRLHVGELDVLDDFPMLWAWFEEDALLVKKFGLPPLHTDEAGYFNHPAFWHLLIERLSLDYHKLQRDNPAYHEGNTTLIEFSRGSEHGGYRQAFDHLSDEVLARASILYVNVSFEESLRKNRRRFNPHRPDSILEHGLSDDKMERLYLLDDWSELAPEPQGFLQIKGHAVPYAVFENDDDVTTGKPDLLAERLESALGRLWELRSR